MAFRLTKPQEQLIGIVDQQFAQKPTPQIRFFWRKLRACLEADKPARGHRSAVDAPLLDAYGLDSQQIQACSLRFSGASVRETCEQVGISAPTLRDWSRLPAWIAFDQQLRIAQIEHIKRKILAASVRALDILTEIQESADSDRDRIAAAQTILRLAESTEAEPALSPAIPLEEARKRRIAAENRLRVLDAAEDD